MSKKGHRPGNHAAHQRRQPATPNFQLGEESQVDTRIPILEGMVEPQLDMVEDATADPRLEAHEVDVRQLQLLMRDWRRGRATRSLRSVLSDGYIVVFTAVVVGAMLINLIIEAQRLASGQVSPGNAAARLLLPWAALFGALATALALARMFGPVLSSAAEGFWVFEAPLRRGRMLAGRLWSIIVTAGVVGMLFGALVAALTGLSWRAVLAWAFGVGSASAGMMAFAAARQGAERSWDVKLAQTLVSLAGVATLLVVVGVAAGWLTLPDGATRGDAIAIAVGVFGLVLAVLAGMVARRRLKELRRADLVSGGALAEGLQGAAFALDFALMRDILSERRANEKGRVKPTRGRGLGASTLTWRDVQRIGREPRGLVLLVVSTIVPYAVAALGFGPLVPPISAIVLMAALIPFMGSLRVLTRTKGLARTLPLSTSQIMQATCTVPLVLTLLWGMATAPAFMGLRTDAPVESVFVGLLTAAAGLLAAIRWIVAKPPDYSGPMMITQMGAMPPGMMMNMVRGFDLIAIITLPLVFRWPVWVSAVIALISWFVLRSGGLDREELMEQAAAQQQELEAMRNPKPKEKIKIQRGR